MGHCVYLPDGVSNPGLLGARRGYLPLYYRGPAGLIHFTADILTIITSLAEGRRLTRNVKESMITMFINQYYRQLH